jgi:hypothetical protein
MEKDAERITSSAGWAKGQGRLRSSQLAAGSSCLTRRCSRSRPNRRRKTKVSRRSRSPSFCFALFRRGRRTPPGLWRSPLLAWNCELAAAERWAMSRT